MDDKIDLGKILRKNLHMENLILKIVNRSIEG